MQAQEGVLASPKKYSLIQIYNFDDLPLIAMNVARIGAQIPSMASELKGDCSEQQSKALRKGKEVTALVGFGPMMWILITPDAPVRGGFHAFDETEINGVEVPETDGDMLLYLSSDKINLNRILAERIKEQFGQKGELIEEVVLEEGRPSNIESLKEKVLIDNSNNLDTVQSSFMLTQKFKTDAEIYYELPFYSFPYKTEYESGSYTLTFSNQPAELKEHSQKVAYPPVSRGLFFLPSLDLLTSLRMGGIRMGSLAINAKWKE